MKKPGKRRTKAEREADAAKAAYDKRVRQADTDRVLLAHNMAKKAAKLRKLLAEVLDHWEYEDRFYRYYHGSFKVYALQDTTMKIVKELKRLCPGRSLNRDFLDIVEGGTGKDFDQNHNRNWGMHTRPMLEAFSHARYFLEMACKYAGVVNGNEDSLASGWAGLLYLYDLR